MDNVTHSLLGAALAKTRLGAAAPLAPIALVVGANLPDFENFVLAFYDRPTDLIYHRSITHSALGVAILIPVFAALIWWLGTRLRPARPRGSFRGLLLGVGLAVASHPVLDWLNTYGLRPWLPFDNTWHYGDLVFIVDPYLWLLLGTAVCLAGRRTRWGSTLLVLLALALTTIVFLCDYATPRALQVAWPVAVTALVIGRWHGFGRNSADKVVAAALAGCIAYVGLLGWSGRAAWRGSAPVLAAQLAPGESIVRHTLSPQPADPFGWQIIAETPGAVYHLGYSRWSGPTGATRCAKNLDHGVLRGLGGLPEVRAWRSFARHPVLRVVRCDDRERVFLMDARYGLFPAPAFSSFVVDLPLPRRPLAHADRRR